MVVNSPISTKNVGHNECADLLNAPLQVVNVGLESFAHELSSIGVPVVHVSWQPPANGDPALARILSKMGA